MRQRPKQASYVQKMDQRNPVVPAAQISAPRDNKERESAAPLRQLQKQREGTKKNAENHGSGNGEGGKMTKYINFDEIPDGLPDSPGKFPSII
jgi:hypothetical protein